MKSSQIQFCNTMFEKFQNGITTTSNQYEAYTVHNCEFRFINNAIRHEVHSVINYVYNSYIHDVNHVKSGGGVIYDHCRFEKFGKISYNKDKADNIAIRNSEIYGDGVQICLNINSITGDPNYAIYNNMISNCYDGIEIWNNPVSVRNNTITDCTRYGLFVQDIKDKCDISYNSFLRNGEYDMILNNVASFG